MTSEYPQGTLAIEQGFQDGFIIKRLPAWLHSASPEQIDLLAEAMRQSLYYRQQVAGVLARIEGLRAFVASRLQTALVQHFRPPLDAGALHYSLGQRTKPISSLGPTRTPVMGYEYRFMPLVDAALRNFTLDETKLGGQPADNGVIEAQNWLLRTPSALQFAKLCRKLDLGERYQAHLEQVLQPATGQGMAHWLQGLQRHGMLLDACKARLEGVFDEAELQLVSRLCRQQELGRLNGARVVAKQLHALGCKLEQIIVLDVLDETFSPLYTRSSRVLVYIPGDPQGPWSAFENLPAFARRVLDKRLRSTEYQAFFRRFVRQRDSQRFFRQVIANYQDLPAWATRELDEAMHAYPAELFASLAKARIEQIKDDAAMIAPPVASIDRAVQLEHEQFMAQVGWSLLGGASFFVPGLGLVLLAVTAWDVLGEVYQGIDAWREGNTGEAAAHMLEVSKDVALIAVTAAGVAVAQRQWQRSTFVDSLVPARLQDGTHKLWNQDLAPYRASVPAAASTNDQLGIRRLGDQQWIEMQGHDYPVEPGQEDGQWQLRPRNGHAPQVLGDGARAWRLWSAQPLEWADTHQLFRRLGGGFAQLDSAWIDQVLIAHEVRAEHLRALLVLRQAPPGEWVDTMLRARLDQRIGIFVDGLTRGEEATDMTLLHHAQRLPEAAGLSVQALAELVAGQRPRLFQAVYEGIHASDSAEVALLRRVFPSLTSHSASAILRTASAADRQRVLDTGQVPLRLAQAARLSTLRTRLARVYEALQFDAPQTLDLARVVLGLLKYLPAAHSAVRWRLFDGYRSETALFTSTGGSPTLDLLHANGQFMVLDANGAVISERQGLFEALASVYEPSQRRIMGLDEPFAVNLRSKVLQLAIAHRQQLEQGFSARAGTWFIAPRRFADGRIGYALSGRGAGRPRALLGWVRMIYPDFSNEQIEAWLAQVRASGLEVEAELNRLDREFTSLKKTLRGWVAAAANDLHKSDREHLMQHLLAGWQRVGAVGLEGPRPIENLRLTIYGIRPGTLPEFAQSVSFKHISELVLPDMELEQVPQAFLQAFPHLNWLDLSGSRLTRLPGGLLELERLRGLVLANNRIVLDARQCTLLASCWRLEYINLAHNPLRRTFSVADLDDLRLLDLNSTGITELPDELLNCPALVMADLRNNRISGLPEAFFTRPAVLRRALRLQNNPLNDRQWSRLRQSIAAAAREVQGNVSLRQQEEERLDGIEPRERWMTEMPVTHRGVLVASWDKVSTLPGTEPFFRVLRQLLHSADFVREPGNMAMRVFNVLDEMSRNRSLSDALIEVANDEWGCRDGASWCFSNLEVAIKVWHAGQGDVRSTEAALLRLARQLWRLDEVDRIAVRDILSRGGNPDQSEVGLAYRVGLRERLGLPIDTAQMSYRALAGVSDAKLDQAYGQVLGLENRRRVAESAVDRSFWQAFLKRTYPERFDALDAPFQQRLQALGEGAAPEAGPLVDVIYVEQRVAQRELMLELTRQALDTLAQARSSEVR
ncbi:NEL-type E3 ubiquitin ligase domain-containing protein [Pseudomonas putida]